MMGCDGYRRMSCLSEVCSKLDMLADYGFVYLTVNMKVRPALDGEDCRHVYVTQFWLYYILLLLLSRFLIF